MDLNVKVAVRCRPMSSKEVARNCTNIVTLTNNSVHIAGIDSQHEDRDFTFDHCYGADSTQPQVYSDLGKPIVTQALDGFNGTIFAYGQTGTGKSFSMMGTDDCKGIIPLLNEDLFGKIASKLSSVDKNSSEGGTTKFMVMVSYLEVYNEEVKDLLNPSDKKLNIRENPEQGIYVEGLCEVIVRDASDVLKLIYQGGAVRRVASTNMNDQSSRSHSVFTIRIEQKTSTAIAGGLIKEQTVKAKVNLVDLAGSERADKTGATGSTLKEGANINKSLMTLGNVINKLSEGIKKGGKVIIPYRESKLTRLLQESLGGNSATVMIASISPADYNYLETVGTLKYANRAKSIANAVTRNEDSNERMIRELQAQIEALKQKLLTDGNNNNGEVQLKESPELIAKLKEMEASKINAWEEREKLSRALEAERQANMNVAISGMMQSVKEEKVQHMKNIKRLTNEKAMLTKSFKEYKDDNVAIKGELDKNIQLYQEFQQQYDEKMNLTGEESELDEVQRQLEAEAMANEMIELLTKIENDRLKYTEKRDALKRMKTRLETIDDEITDERAELVATAGLLNQNDKIREQIQQEEREKMQVEFVNELSKAKEILDEERKNVRETIHSELADEMEALRSEIFSLKGQIKVKDAQNLETLDKVRVQQEYSDSLESRLADSEVAQEYSQQEIERITAESSEKDREIDELHRIVAATQEELAAAKREAKDNLDRSKDGIVKIIEEAKFEMFKKLMDNFVEERKGLEKKHAHTQSLLAQAAKDVLFLSQKNQELTAALNQAIYYEPPIKNS